MRTMTINEYLLESINKRLRERGEEVQVVWNRPEPERPHPQLATRDGNVVEFNRAPSATMEK